MAVKLSEPQARALNILKRRGGAMSLPDLRQHGIQERTMDLLVARGLVVREPEAAATWPTWTLPGLFGDDDGPVAA